MKQMNKVTINGVDICPFTSREELMDYIDQNKSILVAINAEKVMNATDKTRSIINSNTGYCDGVGAVWALKQKGFKNVDKDLYILCGLYVCVLASYVLFEKIVINFRPVIIEGELEASYPSSHTMMSVTFMLAAIQQFSMRLKKANTRRLIIAACAVIGIGIIITRFLSGVHWVTDIILHLSAFASISGKPIVSI